MGEVDRKKRGGEHDRTDILYSEFQRGVSHLTKQSISRKHLTAKLRELGEVINQFQKKEDKSREMSNSFERNICKECNGHGEVDGEPCPECGGTGLAEPIDERIYPKEKEVPKSRQVLR